MCERLLLFLFATRCIYAFRAGGAVPVGLEHLGQETLMDGTIGPKAKESAPKQGTIAP